MPALAPGEIDIALGTLNQVPSDTQGPLGRLQQLINCKVQNYSSQQINGSGAVSPEQLKVQPRDGFVSLTNATRQITDGTTTTLSWSTPELLSQLGNQLVDIVGAVPRVYGGTDWIGYPTTRVLTQELSESVFHTSQRTIQAPDNAYMSGTTCVVWTETQQTSTGQLTTTMVGFKSDDGAWLVSPTALYTSNSTATVTLAKVVSDGSTFFVFYNDATLVHINAYDANGALLAASSGPTNIGLHASPPGTWDIVASPTGAPNTGTVIFAQSVSASTDSGVFLTSVGYNGSAITAHSNLDSTIHCTGPLAFLRNDLFNGFAYLATGKIASGALNVYGWEISSLAQTHEYDTGSNLGTSTQTLDSLTGFASTGVNLTISLGLLPARAAAVGPTFDPAYRFMVSYAVTRGNSSSILRTTQSLCQVSRAFPIDNEYYAYGYYQSGSGFVTTQTSANVTHTSGDFMIGAATQPINVVAGDLTYGSTINTVESTIGVGFSVVASGSKSSTNTTNTDSAVAVTASGMAAFGIPDGTRLLKWTLNNLSVNVNTYYGSTITIAGETSLNSTFDMLGTLSGLSNNHQFYTLAQDRHGSPAAGATFAGTGTFVIASLTCYLVADLSSLLTSNAIAQFYAGGVGSVTVTGSTNTINNITNQPIQRIRSASAYATSQGNYPAGVNPCTPQLGGNLAGSEVWVNTTTQTSVGGPYPQHFAIAISPAFPNGWFFTNADFDTSYIGTNLTVVSDTLIPANVGTYPVTAVLSQFGVTAASSTSVISPQIFAFPFPEIDIDLTTQVPYTFKLQSISPNYTYQGALVSVQGASNPANDGVYQIIQINADGTFIATAVNGLTNQTNEAFTGSQTITIFFNSNIQPALQPTWFLVPLTGSQPVAGRFESGLAYADWRTEAATTVNPYPMAIASVVSNPNGTQVTLPYRAENVTATTPLTTSAGQVSATVTSVANTVGLKTFALANQTGLAYTNADSLVIPGPMASTFSASGFHEDNFNLGLEAPFLVSQSVASAGQLALTPGATYFYQVVAEGTDENGDRIFSAPSPAISITLSGTNNVITLGGRLLSPLNSSGQPASGGYGPTTRFVTYSIYRTAWINGEPTTLLYKITTDLNANGLAPVSTLNASGFSFPDTFSWTYVDQNADIEINNNEILYTSEQILPRYPAPAFSRGVGNWLNREWVVGYDNAIWMSNEKQEGLATSFNPAFRFFIPTSDTIKAIAPMENYLLIFCSNSIWYIPAQTLPDATGLINGSAATLPNPVPLPFSNGSANGFALTLGLNIGVVYDSTAGGLWMIDRGLNNIWLSHPIKDILTDAITGIAIDSQQRLFIQQANSTVLCVYDGVPKTWYQWNVPSTSLLISTYLGQAAYQDTTRINVASAFAAADVINGTTTGIAPDITLAPLNMVNVRGLKRVWEFQVVGTYRGPHNLNVQLSYPEDDQPTTIYEPFTVLADEPYVYPFNPLQEEASQFGIRIFADFNGISVPGDSFALEMVSVQVGMDPVGLNKRPAFVRLIAST